MKTRLDLLVCLFLLLCFATFAASKQSRGGGKKAQGVAVPPAAASLIAPDLARRLARLRPVSIPYHSAGLTEREQKMVAKLVDASNQLEDIFWRQSDPEGLQMYLSLTPDKNNELLKSLLFVNAGRFDLFDGNKPFAGNQPMPPGRGLYPQGLTRAQIEEYVRVHPEKKAEIYSPYTIVRRNGNDLEGVPYHVAFKPFLEQAARDLRDAAALSDDPAFTRFLGLRADALLSDDYYESDLAWVDLAAPKFDIILAPYETYLDDLLGVKTSYGAAVLIRDDAQSAKVAAFQNYVPELQDALPLPAEDRPSKKGMLTPMEVMDSPYRAGDLRHGYQAVADNLPNDPRIHAKKGSKKIFFRNFMDARVTYIILPLAQRLLRPDQAKEVTPDGYLTGTISHEISHGLGPAFARVGGRQVDIREAIGPSYSGLEESKADVVGLLNLRWMEDHKVLTQAQVRDCYAAHVADIFRTVRFGLQEAHSRGEIMQFNYFVEQKAIAQDPSGTFAIDYLRMPQAVAALAHELLAMEANGDRARVEKWFDKYAVMPANLERALAKASDVPVDVNPTFAFADKIQ